jgi:phosphoglycerate kinase
MNEKSVTQARVSGKKVLLRCDFNVPIENGVITDDRRISESIPTIEFLLSHGARVIACSHLGRPHGKNIPELSLKPVALKLSQYLKKNVKIAKDVIGEGARTAINNLRDGEICLLENLRFEIGEENNDIDFAEKLSSLAEIYVNDAFGTCHRNHASLVGVPKFLLSYIGFLIQKEVKTISNAVENPKRPFISILGGAKVSDKIGVIENLIEKVDAFIVGGGMSYTFTNALGHSVGDSICEKDKLGLARDIMKTAEEKNVEFLLPLDNRIGKRYSKDTEFKTVDSDKIPDGWQGLDIGPKTEKIFSEKIKKAGTILWNGPMGVSEWENFAHGTFAAASAISESNAVSIVGGGDSAAAVKKLGFSSKITHISTGGGAALMLLEGKGLPGIEAIKNLYQQI